MLDSFYWEHYYNRYDPVAPAPEDDKKILFENKLLGVPRIRQVSGKLLFQSIQHTVQVKVKNDSCIVHEYFRRLFLTCYDLYREADEDQETFGPGEGTAY